jgi:hypothetical protein
MYGIYIYIYALPLLLHIQAVLGCFKQVHDWNHSGAAPAAAASTTAGGGAAASDDANAIALATSGATSSLVPPPVPRTFFERITKDIEIVRVALLLTGCIQVQQQFYYYALVLILPQLLIVHAMFVSVPSA